MNDVFVKPEIVRVRYIVKDVFSCLNFYTELLGFEIEMNSPNGFAMLSKANLRLLLNQLGAGGAGQSMPDGTVPEPGGWNRIQLQTRDISAAIDHLKGKNARFLNEVVVGNAGKQILLLDPSGNIVEIFESSRN